MAERQTEHVIDEIRAFKRKFYKNKLLKGLFMLVAILGTVYLVFTTLEFSFRFGTTTRALFFFLLVLTLGATLFYYIIPPSLFLLGKSGGMDDEEAAKLIGTSFPTVSDRLLNLLQLMNMGGNSALAQASIEQKSTEVGKVSFSSAIKWAENKKYLKYVLSPVSLIVVLALIQPEIITGSTYRILHFDEEFVPQAPFSFVPEMPTYAFKNEDYEVSLNLEGELIPEDVYLIHSGRKLKMTAVSANAYQFTFSKIQTSKTIRFEGAGFFSQEFRIEVIERPTLSNFSVILDYPAYIGKKSERLSNTGNLQVPEGTQAQWLLAASHTEEVQVQFLKDKGRIAVEKGNDDKFEFEYQFLENDNYSIELTNKYTKNKEKIEYNVSVVKDAFPEIFLKSYQDTILYNLIALGGNISDDYGLRKLALNYQVINGRGKSPQRSIPIPITNGQLSQGYFYEWSLDSLDVSSGNEIQYYVEVWDNDGINGSKSSRTAVYSYKLPSREEISAEIDKADEATQKKIDESLREAQFLEEQLRKAEEELKGKKQLNWEDEKRIQEILDQKKNLEEAIDKLKEMNRNNTLQKERFSPQDEYLKEKARRLQEMMEQMMDEETRKLYEELKKMLEEESGVEQIQDKMDQINRRQKNMTKEIERALELFKRQKLEQELSEQVQQLEEVADKQEKLSEKTRQDLENGEKLLEEQQELQEQFEEIKKNLDTINEMNQELENPFRMPDNQSLSNEIDKHQENSEELLEEMNGKNPEENTSSSSEEKQDSSEENQGESSSSEKQESQEKEGAKEEGGSKDSGSEKQEENNQDTSEEGGSKDAKSQRSKATQEQKDAAKKMEQMGEQMKTSAGSMQMTMMQENLDNLRNIVHNLIKLSFDQEELFTSLKEVKESDPSFISLSQQQLKLRDDAQVLEDSLISLSKRVFMLSSFITREVSNMNEHMESSLEHIKKRDRDDIRAAISEQQFAMTSMNNLALMLDDVLDNMMNAMMQMSGKQQQNKKDSQQSMFEMQQQLNKKIQQLKESGKTGKELSEELAKLAAEQSRIRQSLQEMQRRLDQLNGNEGMTPGGDIPAKMEETELDLVNKRLTEEMIRRQQDILTRLLEAENAMREKEMDEERKGETASDYEKIVPKSFEEYLKQKEQEIEMLKTLPPKMYPYYKKEVSEYFKRMGVSETRQ